MKYSAHVRKYKPFLHCTESFKRQIIETFCLYMTHNCEIGFYNINIAMSLAVHKIIQG